MKQVKAMDKKKIGIPAVLVLTALLAFWFFANQGLKEVNRRQIGIMDTVVTVRVYAPSHQEGDRVIQDIFAFMEELEGELSRHIPGSPVDQVNDNAGRAPVTVPQSVMDVVQRALDLGRQTGGAFDITVAPLVDLWAIGTEKARVPTEGELKERLAYVDYTRVQVDAAARRIFLPEEGMALDLGGVAKGYIVDRSIAALKEQGIDSAYLDAGGDIRVLGSKPDGTPWRIGIRHPRDRNGVFAVLPLGPDLAVVTSGDYQRYFDEEGRRYHHILDPETGYPARKGLASVTVIASDTMTADILSTAFFVLGAQKSLAIVEEMPGVEAVFITEDLEVYMSSGVRDIIELQ
jgi:FAD:protein FMN transferase